MAEEEQQMGMGPSFLPSLVWPQLK